MQAARIFDHLCEVMGIVSALVELQHPVVGEPAGHQEVVMRVISHPTDRDVFGLDERAFVSGKGSQFSLLRRLLGLHDALFV